MNGKRVGRQTDKQSFYCSVSFLDDFTPRQRKLYSIKYSIPSFIQHPRRLIECVTVPCNVNAHTIHTVEHQDRYCFIKISI